MNGSCVFPYNALERGTISLAQVKPFLLDSYECAYIQLLPKRNQIQGEHNEKNNRLKYTRMFASPWNAWTKNNQL